MQKDEREAIEKAIKVLEQNDLLLIVETDALGNTSYNIQKKPSIARETSYEDFVMQQQRSEAKDTRTTSIIALVVSIVAVTVAIFKLVM